MRWSPLAAAVLLSLPATLSAQTPPFNGSWSDIPALPRYQADGSVILAIDADRLLYLAGGDTAKVYRFSFSTLTWTPLADLPFALGRGSCVARRPGSSLLHIFTTTYDFATYTYVARFLEYDITTGGWRAIPAPTGAIYVQDGHRLAATATKIYFFLNQEQQLGELGAFFEYTPDPAGPGTWARLTGPALGSGLAANGLYSLADSTDGFLYGVRSQTRQLIRFTLPAGPWTASDDAGAGFEPLPGVASDSGALTASGPGDGLILMLGDRFATALYRLRSGSFTKLLDLPDVAGRNASVAVPAMPMLCYGTGYSFSLRRVDLAGPSLVSTLAQVPQALSNGGDMISTGTGRDLYAIAGMNGELYHYDVAVDRWESCGPTPIGSLSGAKLSHDGAGFLYVTTPQSSQVVLHRYAMSEPNAFAQPAGTWVPMATLARNSGNGGQCVFAGGKLHYFLGGSRDVWEFTPPAGSDPEGTGAWTLASTAIFTTKSRGLGCTAVYPGSGTDIYVVWGNSTTIFARYRFDIRDWQALVDTSSSFTWGSTLAYPGRGAYLYATAGGTPSAWAYELPRTGLVLGQWHSVAAPPGETTKGAALVHPGRGNYLYCLQGGSTFLWRYAFSPLPTLATVAQSFPGGAPLPPAGLLPARSFEVTATVNDDDLDNVRLEVRAKPVGEAFAPSDPVIATSASSAIGTPIHVDVAGLAPGTGYHWEVRSVSSTGDESAWVPFGTAASSEMDLETAANHAPTMTAMGQFAGSRAIPSGAQVFEAVTFSGLGSDEDGDDLQLQVELRPAGQAFTGQPTAMSTFVAGGLAQVSMEPSFGPQRWAWRVIDAWNGASDWTFFGPGGADFRYEAGGSAGAAACLGSATANVSVVAALALLMLTRRIR